MTTATSKRTGEYKIKQALINTGTMTEGEANAAHVWKGYHFATGENGWHVEPFGRNAYYVGATIAEAIDDIEARADARS